MSGHEGRVWPGESEVDNAMNVLRRDYRHTVVSLAEGFIADVKQGNYDCNDLDTAHDALHETIDGCSDVIYTNAARLVAFCSRYDWESEWEDMGNEKAPEPSQIAFLCLMGEVWEEVESELEEHFEAKEALDNSDATS